MLQLVLLARPNQLIGPAPKNGLNFMARMHSGDKGKHGSKRPLSKKVPSWVELGAKEIEEIIVNQANAGQTPAEIGMVLRDQYGVPSVRMVTKTRVSDILAKHNLLPDVPRDLLNLIEKSVKLTKHMNENKKDTTSKRGYQLTVSKIRRLAKYYKRKGQLPADWRYTPQTAALLVK